MASPGSSRGGLGDHACNSHDVYMEVWKNRRYGRDHHEGFWAYWPGVRKVGSARQSGGCGTSSPVAFSGNDGDYPFYDVDFAVCDDGFTDSCSHRNWPKDWYGVYPNPYTPY